jgi:class 3 adenylate cyclase
VERPELPQGDVTYLFTDVEGSTQLLEAYPATQFDGIERQRSVLTEAVEDAGGVVFETVGDAVYAAFDDVASAVEAATKAQLARARRPRARGLDHSGAGRQHAVVSATLALRCS